MSEVITDIYSGRAHENKPNKLANWLCLAAAPTFAMMALLTAVVSGGPTNMPMPCSMEHGASPFSGMALMYWLMSVFHAAPWLKLIRNRHALQID